MQELVRYLIPWVFLAGLLACVIIPFWFAGSIVGTVFSKSPGAKLRKRWPILLIFGAATFLLLYAFDFFPPRHEIPYPYSTPGAITTADALAGADAIVEGSFSLDHIVSSSRDVFVHAYYPNLKVNVFVIPFQIDRSVRGPSSGTINVKLFFTLWSNTPFYQGLPLREKLLLLLKRDPSDGSDYILVSQNTCWLVLDHPHATATVPIDPATFVLDDAKGFLAACLDHPSTTALIGYTTQPTSIGSFMTTLGGGSFGTIFYPQNDPARTQALSIGKDLGTSDPEFLAIAKKYEEGPWQIGQIARSIRADSGDYSGLQTRLATDTAAPPPSSPGFHVIDERNNLPWELANAVRDSTHPADLLPLVTQAMASPDPRVREEVMRALDQYEARDGYGRNGDRLGSAYFPLIVKMLDDPDQEVRYAALGCTFCISGSVKKRVPDREVNMPATMLFQQDPDLYINKAKTWWQNHGAALTNSSPAAPTNP